MFHNYNFKLMNKKFLFLPILFLMIFFPFGSRASDVYTINLYYNTKTSALSFDKLAAKNVIHDTTKDISIVDFAKNPPTGMYTLKLYQADGKEIISTEFNKKNGAFSVDLPFFSLATSLKIFQKSTSKELLSTDLSEYSTCNGNSICEYEKGESINTCLGDCGTSKVTYSEETQKTLRADNGVIKDPATGEVLLQDKSFSAGQVNGPAPSGKTTSADNTPTKNNQTSTAPSTLSTITGSNSFVIVVIALIIMLIIAGALAFMRFRRK